MMIKHLSKHFLARSLAIGIVFATSTASADPVAELQRKLGDPGLQGSMKHLGENLKKFSTQLGELKTKLTNPKKVDPTPASLRDQLILMKKDLTETVNLEPLIQELKALAKSKFKSDKTDANLAPANEIVADIEATSSEILKNIKEILSEKKIDAQEVEAQKQEVAEFKESYRTKIAEINELKQKEARAQDLERLVAGSKELPEDQAPAKLDLKAKSKEAGDASSTKFDVAAEKARITQEKAAEAAHIAEQEIKEKEAKRKKIILAAQNIAQKHGGKKQHGDGKFENWQKYDTKSNVGGIAAGNRWSTLSALATRRGKPLTEDELATLDALVNHFNAGLAKNFVNTK